MTWKGIIPPPGPLLKKRYAERRRINGSMAKEAAMVRARHLGIEIDPEHWSIYIMESSPDRLIKIGIAKDVGKRVIGLQTGRAGSIHCYGAFTGPEQDIKLLERTLHRRMDYDPRHYQGEWYVLSAEEAVAIIRAFADEMRITLQESVYYPIGDLTARRAPAMVGDISYNNSAFRFAHTARRAKNQ